METARKQLCRAHLARVFAWMLERATESDLEHIDSSTIHALRRERLQFFGPRRLLGTHEPSTSIGNIGDLDGPTEIVAQALVELPPLRERGDDVELLAAQFLAEQASLVVGLELGEEARLALHEHRWLGNVRELRNVIQRAVHLAQGPRLHAHDLALRGLGGLDSHCGQYGQGSLMSTEELLTLPYREAHDQLDHDYLRRIMLETGGNITHAAQRLGTSRRSLRERLKRLGLYTGETSHALRFTTSQAARRSSVSSRLAGTGSRRK